MFRMIVVLMIVGLCVHTAAALPGSGTQQDPWRIESLADFDEFAGDPNYWSGFTRLETDVNLAGRTYSTAVIAPDVDNSNEDFDGTAFTGVFDGNDHKIIGLTIDDSGAGNDYLGLFGCIVEDGEVRNLRLEGGSISGQCCVGGLVGENSGTISNCYSIGLVSGYACIGGLMGVNWGGGTISNCYSTGDISGGDIVGGLIGENWGSVSNCYSAGDVNGFGDSGGLVGHNGGNVSNCYSTGDVSGTYDYVGGLVGDNYGGIISNCYSTGSVSGFRNVGGLVGLNSVTDRPCFPGYIFDSYSTGIVQGVVYVGGLVGGNCFGCIISNCFWDVQTSGEPNMCGWGTGCDPNCGKTTAEMQTKSTFTDAGWDFIEIWGIGEKQTYPFLRTEPAGDFNYDKKVDLFDLAILAAHWLEERK